VKEHAQVEADRLSKIQNHIHKAPSCTHTHGHTHVHTRTHEHPLSLTHTHTHTHTHTRQVKEHAQAEADRLSKIKNRMREVLEMCRPVMEFFGIGIDTIERKGMSVGLCVCAEVCV